MTFERNFGKGKDATEDLIKLVEADKSNLEAKKSKEQGEMQSGSGIFTSEDLANLSSGAMLTMSCKDHGKKKKGGEKGSKGKPHKSHAVEPCTESDIEKYHKEFIRCTSSQFKLVICFYEGVF